MADINNVENNHEHATVLLRPIAAPSVLGLYGFAGATFIVAAHLAGWFGPSNAPLFLFPFAAFFGGLAQFMAGMWSFRARDALATAMHGMWGAFWMAYGLLYAMIAAGWVTPPTGAFPELGFWFIALAAITWVGSFAALAVGQALFWVLSTLAAGSTLMAIAQLANSPTLTIAAGWVFVLSAIIAWYTASGLMLESVYGHQVLPLGTTKRAEERPEMSDGIGEPGVIRGQ